jgi:2-polyprenyl-3-methyl-5-hydroxy-6-metoxy-1,4-benzoquinol methylase
MLTDVATPKACVVCHGRLSVGLQSWHKKCTACSYEGAMLDQNINSDTDLNSMDEGLREEGLRSLRIQNFEILLRQIAALKKNGGRLLDVGCAHGWFLDAANQKGFDVYGIEPDAHIFNHRLAKSHPVRLGYFPEVLDQSEQFDLIVFNDVIEHIPNISDAVAACHQHLANEGLLVLNLPDSQGIFYRLSKVFCRVGFVEFFNRMWQVGLPSPHVHYFNKRNLTKLLEEHGFKVVKSGHLATLHLSGLFARIAYAKGGKFRPLSILTFAAVLLAFPILKLLPGDILFVIGERDG